MPRDGSATRTRILEAATRLVIDNGFRATTVEAVLEAAGTSKGAFFHHFASKQDLAEALVEQYVAMDIAVLEEAIGAARSASDDAVERVLAFVGYFEDSADELMASTSGCLYTSVLTEMELVAAGTSDPITKAIVVWREGFVDLLDEALQGRSDVDRDALADHLWVTFEGTYLLARSTGDAGVMRRQLRVFRELLSALLRSPLV